MNKADINSFIDINIKLLEQLRFRHFCAYVIIFLLFILLIVALCIINFWAEAGNVHYILPVTMTFIVMGLLFFLGYQVVMHFFVKPYSELLTSISSICDNSLSHSNYRLFSFKKTEELETIEQKVKKSVDEHVKEYYAELYKEDKKYKKYYTDFFRFSHPDAKVSFTFAELDAMFESSFLGRRRYKKVDIGLVGYITLPESISGQFTIQSTRTLSTKFNDTFIVKDNDQNFSFISPEMQTIILTFFHNLEDIDSRVSLTLQFHDNIIVVIISTEQNFFDVHTLSMDYTKQLRLDLTLLYTVDMFVSQLGAICQNSSVCPTIYPVQQPVPTPEPETTHTTTKAAISAADISLPVYDQTPFVPTIDTPSKRAAEAIDHIRSKDRTLTTHLKADLPLLLFLALFVTFFCHFHLYSDTLSHSDIYIPIAFAIGAPILLIYNLYLNISSRQKIITFVLLGFSCLYASYISLTFNMYDFTDNKLHIFDDCAIGVFDKNTSGNHAVVVLKDHHNNHTPLMIVMVSRSSKLYEQLQSGRPASISEYKRIASGIGYIRVVSSYTRSAGRKFYDEYWGDIRPDVGACGYGRHRIINGEVVEGKFKHTADCYLGYHRTLKHYALFGYNPSKLPDGTYLKVNTASNTELVALHDDNLIALNNDSTYAHMYSLHVKTSRFIKENRYKFTMADQCYQNILKRYKKYIKKANR